MKNFAGRGECYPPRPKASNNTLRSESQWHGVGGIRDDPFFTVGMRDIGNLKAGCGIARRWQEAGSCSLSRREAEINDFFSCGKRDVRRPKFRKQHRQRMVTFKFFLSFFVFDKSIYFPWDGAFSFVFAYLKKFVYLTSQSRHSSVMHPPLPKKYRGFPSPWNK